jgi:hypothetical protein
MMREAIQTALRVAEFAPSFFSSTFQVALFVRASSVAWLSSLESRHAMG